MEITTRSLVIHEDTNSSDNQISSTTMDLEKSGNHFNLLMAKINEMQTSINENIENQTKDINQISENQKKYFDLLNMKMDEQGNALEKKLKNIENKLDKQAKIVAKFGKKLQEIRILCKRSIEQLIHQVERKAFDIRIILRRDLMTQLKALHYHQVQNSLIQKRNCSPQKQIPSTSRSSIDEKTLPIYQNIKKILDVNKTPFHEEMSSPSAGKRRMDNDVIKLIESKHEVTILGGLNEFHVKFFGPHGTPYEGGVWKVRVYLPDNYPFKSPSIGFVNKIYHPNIDESSGTVCLDVINQAWTALYDLSNIFESFLPQLLTYPNPVDPLNRDAAALYLHEPEEYKKKVADYVQRFATEEALRAQQERESSDSESSMSDFSEDEARDMEL